MRLCSSLVAALLTFQLQFVASAWAGFQLHPLFPCLPSRLFTPPPPHPATSAWQVHQKEKTCVGGKEPAQVQCVPGSL